ncbi:MAG: DUF2155 domain-containing protein [Rhodospirillales bacterium]|nr:DUF2155 domain-containing protein [Rhodospirillales bacterium]
MTGRRAPLLLALLLAGPAAAQTIQSTPLPPLPGTAHPLTAEPAPPAAAPVVPPVVPGQTLPAVPPPPGTTAPDQTPPASPPSTAPVQPVEAEWVKQGGVRLRALDKVTARAVELTGKVGDTLHFGTLAIVVRACVIRPPDRPADAAAFLDIIDTAPGADPATAFHGWMFSAIPALGILQHPTYDIQVAGCLP